MGDDDRHCPRCGATLPGGGAPDDACRRCLLALGLAPGEAAAGDALVSAEATTGTAERVGPFRVLEVLTTGGQSVVCLAEEEASGRRVALRVLRPCADAREVVARLEAVRDVLAGVEHPGLVSEVLAGVSDEGQPYLATEWVPGVPLAEHCDRERLTVRQRVGLLTEVCEAVQHAHAKGLLHLNLEPGKVLVVGPAGRARPRVVDFGVAAALGRTVSEEALFSAQTLLGGGLDSVSPEQLGPEPRKPDPRTDVYALGVLLFELLGGAPPFDRGRLRRADWGELVRIVRQEPAPRPSERVGSLGEADAWETAAQRGTEPRRLARELRGDLDWVTLKALEKDLSRRYPSARALGDDLRRCLNGEAVEPGWRGVLHRVRRKLYRSRPGRTGLVAGPPASGQ